MFGGTTIYNEDDTLDVRYFNELTHYRGKAPKSEEFILAVYLTSIKLLALRFDTPYMQQMIASIKGIDAAACNYDKYRSGLSSYKQSHPELATISEEYIEFLKKKLNKDEVFTPVKTMKK
jgi:hypothetical protein